MFILWWILITVSKNNSKTVNFIVLCWIFEISFKHCNLYIYLPTLSQLAFFIFWYDHMEPGYGLLKYSNFSRLLSEKIPTFKTWKHYHLVEKSVKNDFRYLSIIHFLNECVFYFANEQKWIDFFSLKFVMTSQGNGFGGVHWSIQFL